MSNRYDEWFKLLVAQQCLHGDTSLSEVARQHGLDPSLVRTWRDNYRQHGVMGVRKKYTHRSAAFKLQVLETMWLVTASDGGPVQYPRARRHWQMGASVSWWWSDCTGAKAQGAPPDDQEAAFPTTPA